MIDLETTICDQLGIKYPIIQAGMAGVTTVDLVASVSSAGALGTLGAAYLTPNIIRSSIRKIKQKTGQPFAVNLFCTDMKDQFERIKDVQSVLNRFREELHIPEGMEQVKAPHLFEEQFQILLDEKVPIISTAFGVLSADHMALAKQNGAKVITMITTVKEAMIAERAGTDLIVAQGSDAGGHRGTFDIHDHPDGANIGTFSLIPQVVEHVNVPVIATGGIMNGRGLVAALALGAQGVQLGTAFLPSKQSGAHPLYKQQLLKSTEESTIITKSFSGRPARGIRNRFIQEFEATIAPLPFPTQNTLTSDIRKAAAEQERPEFMSLWAGQGTRLLRSQQNAEDIVHSIINEAKSLLQ